MRRRGFTLVELLIVIIILAVLAAVVVPKIRDAGLRSREASLRATLKGTRGAIDRFKTDTGLFPESLKDLIVEDAPSDGLDPSGKTVGLNKTAFFGPYLEAYPVDPISGTDLIYIGGGPLLVDKSKLGKVYSSASGTALDGTDYATW